MLRIETREGIRRLTLDRPERGNALAVGLVDALLEAVRAASDEPGLHTLLIRGDGRHFCTGFDLSDLDRCSDGDLLLRFVRVEQLLSEIWHSPIRTVAIAQGRTWGAGADLFAACELRLAAPDASFRFPGAGFGLVLGTRRLGARVGADRARNWVIEGRQVDAREAAAAGLASAVLDMEPDEHPGLAQRPAVARVTAAAVRGTTRDDHRDRDLAALVRSAAAPGLRARIAAYRDALRASSGKA
jgi:enoyl-CoA hydratase/carnithine racemase